MTPMPTLGEDPKKSPIPALVITAVIVGLSLSALYVWRKNKTANSADTAPIAAVTPTLVDSGTSVLARLDDGGTHPVVEATPSAPVPAVPSDSIKTVRVKIHGPIEEAFVLALGKSVGASLTQVVNRTLVWWVRVPQDVLRNDELTVVYEERAGQEPLVHAISYLSLKNNKTFEAYRFQSSKEKYAKLYSPEGKELEEHLVDGPLDSWEQISSLLRDGRHHKGVDFKTQVGTPVKATFNGVISRRTWHFRGNGNSLEIKETGGKGRTAMFLHLSELNKSMQPGVSVKKGQVIGASGNTGHSFAPHLHYQLMLGEKVIDPFTSHETYRAEMDKSDATAFAASVEKWRRRMQAANATAG